MNKINLHDEFLTILREKIPNKKQLVDIISDVLRIEKEPASRRLNGKVLFSVQEMGILANELGILLDSLLHKNKRYQWIPFLLESPMSVKSIDELSVLMESNLLHMKSIIEDPSEYGSIFHSLPIELYIHHPYLMKFMFFKWGNYFVGTEEFNNFAQWKVPERLIQLKEITNYLSKKIEDVLYIWDESLIWSLTREINYLYKMQAISNEDKELIKSDLKDLLTQLEKNLKNNLLLTTEKQNVSFYVSHINVGTTSLYLSSGKKHISFLQSSFSASQTNDSYEHFSNVKSWVNSFKNISALISGSGSLKRRSFFLEQHKIIDMFL